MELCLMNLFVNKDIRRFFFAISAVWVNFLVLAQAAVWMLCRKLSLGLLLLSFLALSAVWTVCFLYFARQDKRLEDAVSQINAYLAGDVNARIECDDEGALYRLFHSVNSLAAVLNAHAAKEAGEKEILKNTISDISHQLKTPLAALNIYNGLLQEEAGELPNIKEFAALSEQELDRIETLVQSLLKIAKLDAGSIVFEKNMENVADMMQDVKQHFIYRDRQKQKKIILSGSGDILLFCDRNWLEEAINNMVKNALDHTAVGGTVRIEWKALSDVVQIAVTDNGCGIHPEDLHHIFKRFYRSRFSKDRQGLGLGLPLAKAIVEAHSGTIETDSEVGKGTSFTVNFPKRV